MICNNEEFYSHHLCTEFDVGTVGIKYDILCEAALPANTEGEGHTSS